MRGTVGREQKIPINTSKKSDPQSRTFLSEVSSSPIRNYIKMSDFTDHCKNSVHHPVNNGHYFLRVLHIKEKESFTK